MLYLAIIIILFLLIFHYDYQNHTKYRLSWYILQLLFFILISGLRYRLGVDSTAYEASYNQLPSLLELSSFDFESSRYGIGYIFLTAIARSLSDNFVMMQLLHAAFINCVIFYFFYKNTKHIFTALLLYFLLAYTNYNFEVLRESCAIAMFLLSWHYFQSNKWIKYYICVGIAILFHVSAAILLILPIFYIPLLRKFFTYGWQFYLMMGGVLIISKLVSDYFFDWIKLFEISTLDDYANTYENSDYAESVTVNLIGQAYYFTKIILFPVLAIYIFHGSNLIEVVTEIKPEIKLKLQYMLFWFIYLSIAMMFIKLFYRFCNYFLPFFIIILSEILFDRIKYKKRRIRMSFVSWLTILLPFIVVNTSDYFRGDTGSSIPLITRYYPYASVLNPDKDKQREKLFNYLRSP